MSDTTFSTINLPIIVSLDDIEKTINSRLQGILFEDDNFENNGGDNLKLKVTKRGDIGITMTGQKVNYSVLLEIAVVKDIGIAHLKASGNLLIYFSSAYQINEDWRLVTQTEVLNHTWVKKPVVHLGPVKLPIQSISNRALKKSESIIGETIDKALQNQFDLRKIVHEAWYQLQQPIELSRAYDFWLSITPQKLGMTELTDHEKQISGTIIIHAEAKAVIGKKPVPICSVLLPSYQLENKNDEQFSLKLSTFVPFEEAEKIAAQHLTGETFSTGKQKVRVKSIKLFGLKEKLIVEASLKGAFNGDVLLTGIPVYRAQTKELELENLDYEISTKNILLQSANWLFKKEIEKRLRKELRFPLQQNLEKLEKIVASELDHLEISPNVFLKGDLHTIEVEHTKLEEEGIRVKVAISGKLQILLKGFLPEG